MSKALAYESGGAQGCVYFPTGSSVTAVERQEKKPGTGLPLPGRVLQVFV